MNSERLKVEIVYILTKDILFLSIIMPFLAKTSLGWWILNKQKRLKHKKI